MTFGTAEQSLKELNIDSSTDQLKMKSQDRIQNE